MTTPVPQQVIIAGGGTAGWMTAAALARFTPRHTTITLVESEAIGTVGVGEATIPPLADFNHMLGINEHDFLAATGGTYKLGIDFIHWGQKGSRYFHPFSAFGFDIDGLGFHQIWHWLGEPTALDTFSIGAQAAARARFMQPRMDAVDSPLSQLRHAYHIDAGRYARFLRDFAQERGVQRIEGVIADVSQDPDSGDIRSLTLADGQIVNGDFFIDCSGFRSLLLGQTLGAEFQDWSHWLPCDRAFAVPSQSAARLESSTRSTAHDSGWQWRIPLQHRTGNGHVYCSAFTSDEAASQTLLQHLDTQPTDEPRALRFRTGRQTAFWSHNCVAIGLSAGFLEPLESTSIHLIQEGISKLLALFPGHDDYAPSRRQYNKLMSNLFDDVRDFVILHYHATARDDSEFWRTVRTTPIPGTLAERIDAFVHRGQWFAHRADLFAETSWVAVMLGQGLRPRTHHPLLESLDSARVRQQLKEMATIYGAAAEHMPPHAAYLKRYCAPTPAMEQIA
ncbi:MAG: tryptophan halogenase family protein [Pseudomonadota bacterium]